MLDYAHIGSVVEKLYIYPVTLDHVGRNVDWINEILM